MQGLVLPVSTIPLWNPYGSLRSIGAVFPWIFRESLGALGPTFSPRIGVQ